MGPQAAPWGNIVSDNVKMATKADIARLPNAIAASAKLVDSALDAVLPQPAAPQPDGPKQLVLAPLGCFAACHQGRRRSVPGAVRRHGTMRGSGDAAQQRRGPAGRHEPGTQGASWDDL